MIQKSKIKNQVPTYIIFSISFFILLSLGMWQLNKHTLKVSKQDLFTSKVKLKKNDINEINFNMIQLEIIETFGEILEDKAMFFEPRTLNGKVGFHKIVPVKINQKIILMNRGFVSNKKIFSTEKAKKEKFTGLIIKFPTPKFFELENDLKNNKWYTLNLDDISNYQKLKIEPLLIYEMNNSSDLVTNVTPNTISNINHLNYAITWFLLAFSLSVILTIYMRKN